MRVRQDARLLIASLLLTAAVGCGDDAARADGAAGGQNAAAAGPTPGFATGKITMPDGSPISVPYEEMRFSIDGTALHGENANFTPIINPDGTYKQKLSAGSFRFCRSADAIIKLSYEGKKYTLRLDPVGPNWNRNRESADGIVQDFVWKPTGERLTSDGRIDNHTNWHGGSVALPFGNIRFDINQKAMDIPDGAKCVFTLTPTVAKTIDGQPAKTLTIERKFDKQWNQCEALNDLPIAHYTLTGEVHLADGTKRPMLWNTAYNKYEPSMTIRFEPDETMRSVISLRAQFFVE